MSVHPTFDEAHVRLLQAIACAEDAFLRDYELIEAQCPTDGASGVAYVCWGPHGGKWRITYKGGVAENHTLCAQVPAAALYYIAVALPGLEERIRTERDHKAKLLNTTAERIEEWLRNRIARKEST